MRKGYILLFTFFLSFSYSQIKEYEFTKEILYESKYATTDNSSVASLNKIPNISFYSSADNDLFVANFTFLNYLFYNNKMYSCKSGFSGLLTLEINPMMPISNTYLFENKPNRYSYVNDSEDVEKNNFSVINNNQKKEYNGFECSEYLLKQKNNEMTVCVIENHPINNAQLFTDGKTKTKLNGLVVRFDFEKESSYQIKRINEVSVRKQIDLKGEIYKAVKYSDSIKSKMQKEVEIHKRRMDSILKLDKEKPSPSKSKVYHKNKYESKYKNPTRDYTKLAIDYLEKKHEVWDFLPKYCFKISIPNLKNKNLEYQLKNLSGQICDMYFGEYEQDSISYKGTLDEIRKEYLNIINSFETMEASDKRKIIKYLNSID